LNFDLSLSAGGRKGSPPIIGRTCGFDAKIYKNVGGIFAVSACCGRNKKIFKLFYFCSALPSLLVENFAKIAILWLSYKLTISPRFNIIDVPLLRRNNDEDKS
jgi:hypothetical protein